MVVVVVHAICIMYEMLMLQATQCRQHIVCQSNCIKPKQKKKMKNKNYPIDSMLFISYTK